MLFRDEKNIGHAARAAEGRTAWMLAWKSAWKAADIAAANAESHAESRATIRRLWAETLIKARDLPPPRASDAMWNEQWIPAWNVAWTAAWDEAITSSKASLKGIKENLFLKKWNKDGRAEREAAGLEAGCMAWNKTYSAQIKKVADHHL